MRGMYRVVLEFSGVLEEEGETAAQDIAREFAESRQHHQNVSCVYKDRTLTLTADNDFDPEGLALLDEFSDCICAYTSNTVDGTLVIKSASRI
jgi:hypothetical protein